MNRMIPIKGRPAKRRYRQQKRRNSFLSFFRPRFSLGSDCAGRQLFMCRPPSALGECVKTNTHSTQRRYYQRLWLEPGGSGHQEIFANRLGENLSTPIEGFSLVSKSTLCLSFMRKIPNNPNGCVSTTAFSAATINV